MRRGGEQAHVYACLRQNDLRAAPGNPGHLANLRNGRLELRHVRFHRLPADGTAGSGKGGGFSHSCRQRPRLLCSRHLAGPSVRYSLHSAGRSRLWRRRKGRAVYTLWSRAPEALCHRPR